MSELNGHILEHELLEFIEGVLPPARGAVVSAALARDPRLARLVAAMQEDRRRLMAMGDVQAPPELAERVEAILERQALLGLSDVAGSAEPASLPVSRLRPSRGPIVARIWRSPAGRGLVAAAAVALLAGGGYWGYTSYQRASNAAGPGGGGGPIALNTPEDVSEPVAIDEPALPPVEVASAPEVAAPTEPEVGVEVAAAVGEVESLAATGAAVTGAVSDAALAVATPASAAAGPERDEITPAMAVELARRGLLAIVVESADVDAAVMRVEALAGSGMSGGMGRSAPWRRIDGGVVGGPIDAGFETIAALWSPNFVPELGLPTPMMLGSPTTAVAGDAPFAPALGPGPRVPMELPRWTPPMSQPAAVYAVSLEDRESVLASLVAALRRDGSAGGPARTAKFVRLPVAIDPAPAADPDAVLWWTGTPSNWTWRISVPVIVRRGDGR